MNKYAGNTNLAGRRMVGIGVRLPDDEIARLRDAAEARGVRQSAIVRDALRRYLNVDQADVRES